MKPIVIKPANREEWLKVREDGIGASEVAAVVGLSPWETPFSLWLRKTGQIPPIEENEAMHMGHLLEGVVVQLWEEKTGWKAVKASAKDIIYQDPEHPWRKVTPDRIAYEVGEDGKKRKVLLEIKTTAIGIDPDDLPENYVCQCHYQMHVTGIHVCYLCWLVNGRYYGHARLEYDQEFAEWIAKNVDEFYNNNVKGGVEPDLISVSDYARKGSDPGTTVEADDVALSDAKQLLAYNNAISEKTEYAEKTKDKIKLYMEQAESLTYEGKVIATWKTGSRGRTFLLKSRNIEEIISKQQNNG